MRYPLALTLALCTLISVQSAAAVADTTATPEQVVESLHDVLIEAMQNADSLGFQGRLDLISPVAAISIDHHFMAEKSIGRYWKKLSAEEQQLWLTSFAKLASANYAGRFDGYSGEIFETRGVEDAPHETKLVKTVLILPEDEDVILNYRLRKTEAGAWKIIDIYMNGTVSQFSLHRSEYSSTLKRDGFESLIRALETKLLTFDPSSSRQFAAPSSVTSPATP